jgi:prolyl-tRNA editing enzyme YbaK/EbsC (Cys-tRNA(Pro) deacylase)
MPAHPAVIAALDAAGISFEEMACDPALADTAQFCAAYGIPLENSANTILVASRKPEGINSACLVLATTRLDVNGMVRRRMGARKVSFADADQTRDLTGMEIGGVTPFGLPEGIPVWVDSRVLDRDWIVVGAGSRSAKIRLDPAQLNALPGVEVVEDLAQQPPAA